MPLPAAWAQLLPLSVESTAPQDDAGAWAQEPIPQPGTNVLAEPQPSAAVPAVSPAEPLPAAVPAGPLPASCATPASAFSAAAGMALEVDNDEEVVYKSVCGHALGVGRGDMRQSRNSNESIRVWSEGPAAPAAKRAKSASEHSSRLELDSLTKDSCRLSRTILFTSSLLSPNPSGTS